MVISRSTDAMLHQRSITTAVPSPLPRCRIMDRNGEGGRFTPPEQQRRCKVRTDETIRKAGSLHRRRRRWTDVPAGRKRRGQTPTVRRGSELHVQLSRDEFELRLSEHRIGGSVHVRSQLNETAGVNARFATWHARCDPRGGNDFVEMSNRRAGRFRQTTTTPWRERVRTASSLHFVGVRGWCWRGSCGVARSCGRSIGFERC
mmetsp:Transcript_2426/g.3615  ORF Transcript_2426/g.3615 Transcript_2426/m.3615 type:complete len:203 (-) Transcript_2426:804-1412(-)